ncbi:MAG: Nif11-like leader peptide family natural product precursor [Atopobiaceae bacterium]|nr:Nif11-like leader peptide family natural product precursor [Atopobiaceae bacterium]
MGAGIFMWKAGSIDFDDLTPQKKDQIRACNSSEELIALAKKEGYELTDEQIEGIAGGWGCHSHSDDCINHHVGGRY